MKDELSYRPLVLGFIALVCSLAFWFSPVLLAVVLGCVWMAKGWFGRGFVVGLVMLGVALAPQVPVYFYHGEEALHGRARVAGIPELTETGSRVTAEFLGKRVRLRFAGAPHLVIGDQIEFSGVRKPLSEGSGWADGCSSAIKVNDFRVVETGWSWLRPGLVVRDSFRQFIDRSVGDQSSPFLKAVCFGDTSEIAAGDWDAFQRSGTTHIVSTSGLHAAVVCFAVFFLARLLPISRLWQIVLVVPFLFIYASAAGFGAPIIRACLMVLAYSFAYIFRRESDGLSSLAGAGIVGLFLNPADVMGVGFWLSILAVGSLTMIGPFDPKESRWRRLIEADIKVFFATAPVVAAAFGRISLVGLIANLISVPAVGVLVVGSLAAWLLSLPFPQFGRWIAQVVIEPVSLGYLNFTDWASGWSLSIIEAPYVPLWSIVVLVVSMALIWRPKLREA